MSGAQSEFSDYIAFVDESGDHGMVNIDSSYSVFVLALCVFRKTDYMETVCPAVQRLKFKYWGHDAVVLHEHDIRKPRGEYGFLHEKARREDFLGDVSALMESAPFSLIAAVIDKEAYRRKYVDTGNPYDLSLQFVLERFFKGLESKGQANRRTPVIVESRGKREDAALELEFRRICDEGNILRRKMPFEIEMVKKRANLPGLQIADLVARPIGIKHLRPDKPNLAYDIIEKKFRRSGAGKIEGWGLKCFP